jgi:hypothetical protein
MDENAQVARPQQPLIQQNPHLTECPDFGNEPFDTLILTMVGSDRTQEQAINNVMPLILSRLHALRLCFLLTIYVQLDRLYRLPDSLRTLPLSRYLAALVSTHLTMLTFLFRLRFSRLRCLCLLSSLLDTYTRESSLQILTQTHLLLTKYYTKLLSANYQVADASPY